MDEFETFETAFALDVTCGICFSVEPLEVERDETYCRNCGAIAAA